MSNRQPPSLKSTTNAPIGPRTAQPAAHRRLVGGPKVAAEGVASSLLPDPRPGDGRYPIAWLHITAPGRGALPTVRSWCACGRDLFTVGHRKAAALIADHQAHRERCPLRSSEGKAA